MLSFEAGKYSFVEVIKTMVDRGFRHMPIVKFTKQSLFGRPRKDAGIIVTSLLDIVDANLVLTCKRSVPKGLGMTGWVTEQMPSSISAATAAPAAASTFTAAAGVESLHPALSRRDLRPSLTAAAAADATGVAHASASSLGTTVAVSESTVRMLRRVKKLCEAVSLQKPENCAAV